MSLHLFVGCVYKLEYVIKLIVLIFVVVWENKCDLDTVVTNIHAIDVNKT